MRWVGQQVGEDGVGADAVLPGMHGVLRTVRVPDFAGMVFHEVEAKSVLNKVPSQSAMPFGWTVNPYRGCSHACTYCLVGDTPVLLADGRTRPIAELRVGDAIYGTERRGAYRRYVRTTVLAHWSTVKPAYRIALADGTELIASGDHRFLTERGWKHVVGQTCGHGRRPHLTTGNSMLGTGRFADGPMHNESYQRGYLCGMIRGDGHIGRYPDLREGRVATVRHQFRLALADPEALQRARLYLANEGVRTDEFAFGTRSGARRAMRAIRNQSRSGVEQVEALIEWPMTPELDWCRGFLAGVFDAEGSSHGTVRIHNADAEILRRTSVALGLAGFRCLTEPPKRDGVCAVRLLGGQVERIRFFQAVDPAITRKRSLFGEAIKNDARLGVVAIEPLGVELPMYDVTTGTGDFIANGVVSHNCFARNTHTYLELDPGEDFNRQVVVKVNAARVLERELRSPRWGREHVAMGTNTDPYQRVEGRYRLMPGIITALARWGTPFSILTKGTLLARDLPLLTHAARDVSVGVGVSIALLDRQLQASLEPGTPTPAARLDLVRRLTDAGMSCGVMVAPVLPWLTDSTDALDALLAQIAAAGASGATVLALHLRPGTREWFMAWLAREHPGLVDRYLRLYARGAYVDRRYREALGQRVGPLLRRHGLARQATSRGLAGDERAGWPRGSLPGPRAGGETEVTGEQLSLM